jgi:hypothetical protein
MYFACRQILPGAFMQFACRLCKWARVPVWLDTNLDIATKKAFSSIVEAIHASIETLSSNGLSRCHSIFLSILSAV